MQEKRKTKIGKFLSLVLRHKPEEIGLNLDESGWVKVSDLLKACTDYGKSFTRKELEEIVETSDKKRFAFDETGTKIRANQGHSVALEIAFEKRTPPEILYHGTAEKNLGKIFADGLKKMNRHHVHLSADQETARKVGQRYGKPVVLEIQTARMMDEGFEFFVSDNDVWLIEQVPPRFLKLS
jgi:putative RNA 2'-phosphotransferase